MKRKLKCFYELCFLMSICMGFSRVVSAANNQAGSDSCGLGWEITQRKTLFGTWTRATTNSFLPSSFSMTSGTSGCDQHMIVKADEEGVRYVSANREALSIDIAQGSGEYLDGLAKVIGCSDSALSNFGAMVQKNYQSLMGVSESISDLEFYHRVKDQIRHDPLLAIQCEKAV